jgi:iron complex outermembrane receptor protein
MKNTSKSVAVLALLASTCPLWAQNTPAPAASPAAEKKDDLVVLSPFLVSAGDTTVGRYTSLESTSAGRVRVNIMDSSQNVSVITNEMLQDVAAGRILDATKYIAGISESTLGSNAQDRTNVRGFQADGHTVDGFTYGGFINLDPAIIDRIEVVKGPNAILAPQPTSPGGTVNNASKKPQFRDFGSVSVQFGKFDANSANFDINQGVNDHLAARLVASYRNWDNWWQGSSIRSTTIMPGMTYRFSDTAQITLQYIYTDWKSTNYLGLPIDETAGTNTEAKIMSGVPHDLSVFNENDIYRIDQQHDFKLLFTAELWGGIQMRLNALYHKTSQYAPQLNTAVHTDGNRDPLTGDYIPGMSFQQVPPYAATPIPSAGRTFARSGTDPRNDPRQTMIQNDYAYLFENESVKSTTLVGFAFTETTDYGSKAYNISAPNFNIDTYVDVPWTRGTLNFDNRVSNQFMQGYIAENLALLDNRLILNAAISKNYYRQRARYLVTGIFHGNAPEATLPAYGVVIKPWKDKLSLYYSYSEQSTANAPSNSVNNTNPPLTSSEQNEFGARFKPWGDKLYFTVSYFDIIQNNFSVPNPGNLTTPPPNPLLPPLFSDRTAKGWEFELRANPTKNISIIGNYTNFENRDPNNVEFRGTAEQSGAVLFSYTFHEETPALDGFRAAIGIDYIGDRPGDAAPGGYTAASTPDNPIPNQPSFYLGARTLVGLTLAYDTKKHWSFQLNVDNLFNEEYLMASINRSLVYTGTPTNARATVTYRF